MPAEDRLALWYSTFLDVVKAAKRRDMGIACHPSNKAPIQDMMERVYEDPEYNLGDLPPLVVHRDVEPGCYQLINGETMRLLTMQAAMQDSKGLGRYQKMYTPDRQN